ncbi:MAG: SBBP repeat-containing protein, partial [Pseudomonadota bacterium]
MTKKTKATAAAAAAAAATTATTATRRTAAIGCGLLAALAILIASIFLPTRPVPVDRQESAAGSVAVPATSGAGAGKMERQAADRAPDLATEPDGATAAVAASSADPSADPSAGQRETAARTLDGIAPPIAAAAPAATPGSASSLVMRDRNVSAFFVESGLALALAPPETSREPWLEESRPAAAEAKSGAGWGLHWNLTGARPVAPRPEGELPGKVSYFVGPERAWRTGIPTFARVAYAQVYPGIDMTVESRRHGVEYRFVVEPGAKVDALRMRYRGALAVRVVEDGKGLEIETGLGVIREEGLTCYQKTAAGRREVAARYSKVRAGSEELEWEYGIEVGEHDAMLALVVDPVIGWSSYLGGGGGSTSGRDIAVDSAGNVYVTGETVSADFPASGGFDTTYGGSMDAFVVKVKADGTSIDWSSYLGGTNDDSGYSLAIDGTGNVYVTGYTGSADFPSSNGFDTAYNG